MFEEDKLAHKAFQVDVIREEDSGPEFMLDWDGSTKDSVIDAKTTADGWGDDPSKKDDGSVKDDDTPEDDRLPNDMMMINETMKDNVSKAETIVSEPQTDMSDVKK